MMKNRMKFAISALALTLLVGCSEDGIQKGIVEPDAKQATESEIVTKTYTLGSQVYKKPSVFTYFNGYVGGSAVFAVNDHYIFIPMESKEWFEVPWEPISIKIKETNPEKGTITIDIKEEAE